MSRELDVKSLLNDQGKRGRTPNQNILQNRPVKNGEITQDFKELFS